MKANGKREYLTNNKGFLAGMKYHPIYNQEVSA